MADLPEALDRALTARYKVAEVRTPATQRRGLTARMNQLEKAHARKGDRPGQAGARAAKAAGISPGTWARWRSGKQKPSAPALRKLETAHKNDVRLPALDRSRNAKGVPTRVTVTAITRWAGYYNRTRYRSVRFGPGGMRAVMSDVIDAWGSQGPQAAADAFERGISTLHNVPGESGYEDDGSDSPGIRFEGNQVHIEFED